jgi:hypothetical protein
MTGQTGRFLRFLAIVDGRTRLQIAAALGCSLATVKRMASDAEQIGVVLEVRREQRDASRFAVSDYGPFDVLKLRALPWRRMEVRR